MLGIAAIKYNLITDIHFFYFQVLSRCLTLCSRSEIHLTEFEKSAVLSLIKLIMNIILKSYVNKMQFAKKPHTTDKPIYESDA